MSQKQKERTVFVFFYNNFTKSLQRAFLHSKWNIANSFNINVILQEFISTPQLFLTTNFFVPPSLRCNKQKGSLRWSSRESVVKAGKAEFCVSERAVYHKTRLFSFQKNVPKFCVLEVQPTKHFWRKKQAGSPRETYDSLSYMRLKFHHFYAYGLVFCAHFLSHINFLGGTPVQKRAIKNTI